MNKSGYYFLLFVGLLMAIMMGYNAYQAFYPFKTVNIENPSHLTVLTPRVKVGEDLVYVIKYCRYFSGVAKVYRNLIGPDRIPTAITESATQPGCRQANSHINVPLSTTPGTYQMQARAEFQINPQRVISVNYQTENFEVYK